MSLILQGCSYGTVRPSDNSAILASSSTELCPERILATEGTFPHLIENHLQLIEDYEICKARHESLVRLIKSLAEE